VESETPRSSEVRRKVFHSHGGAFYLRLNLFVRSLRSSTVTSSFARLIKLEAGFAGSYPYW